MSLMSLRPIPKRIKAVVRRKWIVLPDIYGWYFWDSPTGFSSFECLPSMPSNWDTMSLKNIAAFGMKFNVNVSRMDDLVQVLVTDINDNTIHKTN